MVVRTAPTAVSDALAEQVTRSQPTWLEHAGVLKALAIVADLAAIALAMTIAVHVRGVLVDRDPSGIPARNAHLALISLPIWVAVFARYRLYSSRHIASRLQEVRLLVNAVAFSVLGMAAASYLLQIPVARGWLALVFFSSFLLLTGERELVRRAFLAARRRGWLCRRVVIVGGNGEAQALSEMLGRNRGLGYSVVGLVGGQSEQLFEVLQRVDSDSVIIAASSIDAADTNRLVRELTTRGVHVELSSSLFDISADRLTVRPLGNFPVLYLEPVRRTGWRALAKRTLDTLVAGFGLVILAPVMAVIALAIKLTSPGPVIFRQTRVGHLGAQFEMLKFRTMVLGASELGADLRSLNDVDGPIFKMRNDPRVTRVGRPLRSFSLDELPQLWNVVRGQMSLVGPRPALPTEAEEWDPEFAVQRLSTRPGVTGMWQVSGRSDLSWDDYVRLDLFYVDNWSLWWDLAIVAKTIPTVLFRRGAM